MISIQVIKHYKRSSSRNVPGLCTHLIICCVTQCNRVDSLPIDQATKLRFDEHATRTHSLETTRGVEAS